jgi:ADP-ribose pyrophosphatase YjhB (NUDIX family)
MEKIFVNIDNGEYITESVLSYSNYVLLREFKKDIQELSGFVVVVNDKILLVKPKKFKGLEHKWSIPKGKVEDRKKFKNALKELKEETGIILNDDVRVESEKIKIYYKKSGKLKELTAYIIRLNESDLNVDVDHKWEVSKDYLDRKEIYKAKFFTKKEALNKIEMGQMPLLKLI